MTFYRKTWVYFIPLFLLMLVCIVKMPQKPLSDFAGYYFGGTEILKGAFENAYDMEVLNFSIAAQGYKNVSVSYAPFPPFTALVFAPFTLFPVEESKLLFVVCSCLFFLFTLFRAVRHFKLPDYTILLIPFIFFIPIVNNIFFGQSYLFLLCLLLEGYMAQRQGKVLLGSFLWAFAILFKLFPGVLFLYLLLCKKYKDALCLGFACCVLLLFSVGINGVDSWMFYLTRIIPKLNAGELNHPFTFAFQSAFMLGKKVFVYDQLLNPAPLFRSMYLFILWMGLFKALIISVCVMLTIRNKEDDFLSFSVWILASMLVSPNGSTYSLILLILPLFALLRKESSTGLDSRIRFLIPFVLLLTCNLRIHKLDAFPVLFQFPRLYLLLLFLGLILPWSKKIFNGGFTFCLFCVLTLPALLKAHPPKDESRYLLRKDKDLFIYDYSFKNGQLSYSSWDGKNNETMTGIPVLSFSNEDVILKSNQIYYKGKQMTHSADWKKKVCLINGNTIIYLSDKDRGVCFYTLRKIVLPPQDGPVTFSFAR